MHRREEKNPKQTKPQNYLFTETVGNRDALEEEPVATLICQVCFVLAIEIMFR